MLTGFTLLIIGAFVSTTYFIVIPIIPDKKHPSMVTAIKIPIFVFSFVLISVATATPNVSPANDPMHANNIISGKLLPKSTFSTNTVKINNIAIPNNCIT